MYKSVFNLFFLILISCNENKNSLSISYYPERQYSMIQLFVENAVLDSLRINDYYGSSELVKIQDNLWSLKHPIRCGSDCRMGIQYLISIQKNKIVKLLQLPWYNDDPELIENFNLLKINFNQVEMEYKKELVKKNERINVKMTLTFDKELNLYYNDLASFNGIKYKCIKIEESTLIRIKNEWFYLHNGKLTTF